MSSFPRLRKPRLKRRLLRGQTRQSIAIRVRIMPSLGIMAHTTMPRRQRSPTSGQANFYINDCGDLRTGRRFYRAEKRSRERLEQSRTDAVHAAWIKARLRVKRFEMIRKIEMERFSLTSSKRFDEVISSVKAYPTSAAGLVL